MQQRKRVPWHLWLVALFFVFMYVNGVYDYFMMLGHNVAYYASKHYGEAVVAYFTDYPVVPLVFWTTNIFSGLVAPILLLFRSRWAVQISLVSAVAILCQEAISFTWMNRWHVLGPWISLFDIAILLLTFGLFGYCRAMAKRGVLR